MVSDSRVRDQRKKLKSKNILFQPAMDRKYFPMIRDILVTWVSRRRRQLKTGRNFGLISRFDVTPNYGVSRVLTTVTLTYSTQAVASFHWRRANNYRCSLFPHREAIRPEYDDAGRSIMEFALRSILYLLLPYGKWKSALCTEWRWRWDWVKCWHPTEIELHSALWKYIAN